MAFWVYVLRCADGSYYTGQTDNLERRLAEHSSGAIRSCYTFGRRPLRLVFSEGLGSREDALAAERRIKGWSRAKKEALSRRDWAEVSRLASQTSSPSQPRSQGSGVEGSGVEGLGQPDFDAVTAPFALSGVEG